MDNRENDATSPREHNNKRIIFLGWWVLKRGTNWVARELDVNPKYVSECANKLKVPSNPEIATKMGFRVYEIKTSVPYGAPRTSYPRAHVSKNTDPKKIAADLLRVTGDRWVRLEEEMEY